jgi:putative sterol carrier protein
MGIETIQHYMHAMGASFSPARASGQSVVLQYEFTGRQCGICHAVISDGTITVAKGPHPTPSAAVTVDFDLWLAILAYQTDGLIAFQEGRYDVRGDPMTLLDSNAWFER